VKQSSSQAILHLLELLKCLKMLEFLSVSRCSRTLVDKCRLVSPTYAELHSAQINLYTTLERNDLGTESLTFIKFLILNEENTNLMLRFLQYRLTMVRILRWAK